MITPDFQTFQSNRDLKALSGKMSEAVPVGVLTAPGEPDWVQIEHLAADPDSPDFAPATAWLIRGALDHMDKVAGVAFNWECFEENYTLLRADHRAVLAVGFRRLSIPCPEKYRRSTHPELIRRALRVIAQGMTHAERKSIACLDRHSPWQDHLAALDQVIDEQECRIDREGQYWYPHEAVSLAGYLPDRPGFLGAIALLLIDEMKEPDFESMAKWSLNAVHLLEAEYSMRSAVLAGFRHCYEASEHWNPDFPGTRRKDPQRPMVPIPLAAPEFLMGAVNG